MKRGILNSIIKVKDRMLHPPFTINRQGQTSLIMILVIAMAFIFYAISLNWSRMANLKTTTWMTATGAASQVASMFASYGERVMWENLLLKWGKDVKQTGRGSLKHCESTYLFIKILVLVIVIVIMVIAQQYWVLILIVSVMMAASLVIDYAVIRPMMFNMWNKLQQNMQTLDQFRESGITSGIQSLSADGVYIPDRFDSDANGLWGFIGGTPKDHIGRFAFYYNERLKFIKPPDTSAYEAFRGGMENLVTKSYNAAGTAPSGLGFNPLCSGSNHAPPLCDPQCTGISSRPSGGSANVGFGWQYGLNKNLVYYVPVQCMRGCSGAACPATMGNPYYLLYDDSIELPPPSPFIPYPNNPGNPENSFRFRLGHDDEMGKDSGSLSYDSSRASGIVFPMLSRMENIDSGKAFATLGGLSATARTSVNQSIDAVTAMDRYKQEDITACAESRGSSDSKGGFFWKRGADRYCSGPVTNPVYKNEYASLIKPPAVVINPTPRHWPYYQCEYMYDPNTGTPVDCQPGAGDLWPQDHLDDFVYQLSSFVQFYNYLKDLPTTALVEGLNQWYPQAASYIAPQCTADACKSIINSCKAACSDDECKSDCDGLCEGVNYPTTDCSNPADINEFVSCHASMTNANNAQACSVQHQGYMLQWMYDLNNWKIFLNNWLNQDFGTTADLCSGSLSNIVNCLSAKTIYTSELHSCQSAFPATSVDPKDTAKTLYPDMPLACIKVIRLGQNQPAAFFVPIAPESQVPKASASGAALYPTNAISYPLIKTWIDDNVILKDAVTSRYNDLNRLYGYTTGSLALFQEGYNNFSDFLSPGGPADTLMNVRLSSTISLKRLPGFVIYGWKDNKISTLDKSKTIGMWHLSRMEVIQPSLMPYVHPSQKFKLGWLGPDVLSCYEFRYGAGSVWTRATRWDEDTVGVLANFANKQSIWRFQYSNPHPPHYNPIANDTTEAAKQRAADRFTDAAADPRKAIEQYCVGRVDKDGPLDNRWAAFGKGIGITQDTKNTLLTDYGAVDPSINSVPDEAKAYQEGFMINLDPRFKISANQPYVGSGCNPPPKTVTQGTCTYDTGCDVYNWDDCCNVNQYNNGRASYWGSYWGNYCKQTNKAKCQQNMKNGQLVCAKEEMMDCFYVVNALLNKGVKSTSGAEYWVQPHGNGVYHEQIKFHSSQEADKEFGKNNNESNTIVDTDLYK